MKQQLAVEWLISGLISKGLLTLNGDTLKLIGNAKEMENEQIVEAFFQGVDRESDGHGAMYLSRKDAEKYYNETFKSL